MTTDPTTNEPTQDEAQVAPDSLEEDEAIVVRVILETTASSIDLLAKNMSLTKHPARALHLIEQMAHSQLGLLAVFNAEARSYLPPPEDSEYGTTNPGETFGATVLREILPVAKMLLDKKTKIDEAPRTVEMPMEAFRVPRRVDFFGVDAAVRALQAAKEAGDEELVQMLRKAIQAQIEPPGRSWVETDLQAGEKTP